jgi:hypothetical protein
MTRPVVATVTAVPLVRSKLGAPSPVIGAPFWSRAVAVIWTVSWMTRFGLVGEIDSDVKTDVGGGGVPPPPPPQADRPAATTTLNATVRMQSPISRVRDQRKKLSRV